MILNIIKIFIKFIILCQIFFSHSINEGYVTDELKEYTCDNEKHETETENLNNVFKLTKEEQLIEFIDFEVMPTKTLLKNLGHMLVIAPEFNQILPKIKINFAKSLKVQGTFCLHYMFFGFFEKLKATAAFERITSPEEFNVVFRNIKSKDIGGDIKMENGLVILSLPIQLHAPSENESFDVLHEHLEEVREILNEKLIPNYNLKYWLQAEMKKFYAYRGTWAQLNCDGKVIWIDYKDTLSLSTDSVILFKNSKAGEIIPLDQEYYSNTPPKGHVFANYGNYLELSAENAASKMSFVSLENENVGILVPNLVVVFFGLSYLFLKNFH